MRAQANTDDLPRLPSGESLIDSHCHLDMAAFDDDRDAVLSRAAHAGVAAMVTIGAGGPVECNHSAIGMAETHPNVFATVGIHPHDASNVNEETFGEVSRLADHPKVVAIGETGLDYHYDNSPRPVQQEAFRQFIDLARRKLLPIVVHLREADVDALRILREERAAEIGGVIHCYSSGAEAARKFLDLGFHISFSGIVTFKAADKVRAAARLVPEDRILVETDAPFLAPAPDRGRRNEPALVVRTAECLATVRGEQLATVSARTRENTRTLFGLG